MSPWLGQGAHSSHIAPHCLINLPVGGEPAGRSAPWAKTQAWSQWKWLSYLDQTPLDDSFGWCSWHVPPGGDMLG